MDTGDIIDAVVSHAQALGVFDMVNQHEPKSAPGSGITCAVWSQSIGPARRQSGLNATTASLVMNVRLYMNMLTEPQDWIDPAMVSAADLLMNSYSSDFTLDGLVRNVDLLGMAGPAMTGTSGYVKIDGAMMRIITIVLPLIINDAWEQVA